MCYSLIISGVGLRGLQQHLYNMKFQAILSYHVSNQSIHHDWLQRKMFNITVSRWPENAVLGAFVVNKIQKDCPNFC